MNICFLSNKYPPDPGGLAISSRRLAAGLADSGHHVQVCLPTADLLPGQVESQQDGRLTIHRLGLHRRPDDSYVDWFELVIGLHRRSPFDLIQGHYVAGAGFIAVYAGRYLGIPSVISARGNDLERTLFRPDQAGPLLWALSQASAVTAVSTDLARKARALAPRQRIETIANSVDVRRFMPQAGRNPVDLEAAPLVGFVGEARQKKGLTIMLPAFKLAAKAVEKTGKPAPALLLIGGIRKDDRDILKVFQTQNPRLKAKLYPYLSQEELIGWYHRLDLLVLPSLRDGLPNALLEGLACGLAVVASDVGGIPDVIRHGENGLLVPAGDVEALAQAIVDLLEEPDRREALGRAGRLTVESHFRPEQELEAYLALYESIPGEMNSKQL